MAVHNSAAGTACWSPNSQGPHNRDQNLAVARIAAARTGVVARSQVVARRPAAVRKPVARSLIADPEGTGRCRNCSGTILVLGTWVPVAWPAALITIFGRKVAESIASPTNAGGFGVSSC